MLANFSLLRVHVDCGGRLWRYITHETQSFHHIETSFYMMATLAFNELIFAIICLHEICPI